jgi:hypothetical protein
MRTKVETSNVSPDDVDGIIRKAYGTVSNNPKLGDFTFDEVFSFLSGLGYNIVSAKGMAKVVIYESSEDMTVNKRDGGYNEVEDVFAYKDGQEIPIDFGSEQAKRMKINSVFLKELKLKLLK